MITIQIPIEILKSMKRIVDMYISDELRHYNESSQDTLSDMLLKKFDTADGIDMNNIKSHVADQPGLVNHIYNDLELVNRFLHSQDLQHDIDKSDEESFDNAIDNNPDNIDAYLHEEEGGDK